MNGVTREPGCEEHAGDASAETVGGVLQQLGHIPDVSSGS